MVSPDLPSAESEIRGERLVKERLGPLLWRIAGGDESALAAFYDLTSRWVYGLALKILNDPASAEEATLDVYLQVWRTAASFAPERGSPEAWLQTVARSRAIDRFRLGASRRRREEPFQAGFDRASGEVDPLAASAEAERGRLVAAAIQSLPPEQKRAIELAYFRGLTHGQIARRLEEPLGTVKTRIRLGMMKLRDLLKPLEDPK
jgi:RNA polymerase sigma-70 factor (ECF subfamily)